MLDKSFGFLNPVNILYGLTPWKSENDLVNHIILIYKQILFYHRDQTRNNSNNLMPYFIKKKKKNHLVHGQAGLLSTYQCLSEKY